MSAQSQQVKQNFLNHPYVQQASQVANSQLNVLDKELSKYGFLNDLEARTKVPKAYGVLGLAVTFVTLIFFNLFGLASPVSNLVGWALPAYLSVRAIESPGTNDDKQWLTYWVTFGLFNFLESAALRPILYWFPFYFVFKTVFTVWLFLPSTRGAEILYANVIRPVAGNVKSRVHSSGTSTFSSAPSGLNTNTLNTNTATGFSTAGTTAPTTFEHEKTL